MKKFIKRTLYTSIILLIVGAFLAETQAAAAPNRDISKVNTLPRKPFDPNFKPHYTPEDRKEAEAYSKKKYETWSKDFKKEEKRVLEEYKKKTSETLAIMREYRGNIEALRKDAKKSDSESQNLKKKVEEIDKVDKMIKVKENKMDTKQTIYTYFSATDMGYSENKAIQWKGVWGLDHEKLSPFLAEYEYGLFNDIRAGDLIKEEGAKEERFVMEITVPQGMYLAHLGDGKVLLPSGYGVVLDTKSSPTFQTIKGKEMVHFKAKLVEKKEIENLVERNKNRLNEDIVKTLVGKGIERAPELKALCKFEFNSPATAYGIYNAKEAMNNLVNNPFIPKKLLEDSLFILIKNKGPLESGIVFTDTLIEMKGSILGKTYFDEKTTIFINASSAAYLERWDTHLDIANTLHHELGHVVDQKILKDISSSAAFKEIFEREKDRISLFNTNNEYAKTHPTEFFAEIFKSMYSTGTSKYPPGRYHDSIRKEAPEAVAFIEKALQNAGYTI